MTLKELLSSMGATSEGICFISQKIPNPHITVKISANPLNRMKPLRALAYRSFIPVKNRSLNAKNFVNRSCFLSSLELSIGVRDNDTTVEMTIAPDTTIPNSLKRSKFLHLMPFHHKILQLNFELDETKIKLSLPPKTL